MSEQTAASNKSLFKSSFSDTTPSGSELDSMAMARLHMTASPQPSAPLSYNSMPSLPDAHEEEKQQPDKKMRKTSRPTKRGRGGKPGNTGLGTQRSVKLSSRESSKTATDKDPSRSNDDEGTIASVAGDISDSELPHKHPATTPSALPDESENRESTRSGYGKNSTAQNETVQRFQEKSVRNKKPDIRLTSIAPRIWLKTEEEILSSEEKEKALTSRPVVRYHITIYVSNNNGHTVKGRAQANLNVEIDTLKAWRNPQSVLTFCYYARKEISSRGGNIASLEDLEGCFSGRNSDLSKSLAAYAARINLDEAEATELRQEILTTGSQPGSTGTSKFKDFINRHIAYTEALAKENEELANQAAANREAAKAAKKSRESGDGF
ncbi:hypothetical protein QFC24_003860 [Naganishia onofrii]|uniref:Uncharacterized protein n=1 Tax=Naganishia onofrii TaxID=1851511 RepID=A0ACC2XHB3_9TREE|nr:hypothetical protein QFC24_003860 [Naganishia onofrii]